MNDKSPSTLNNGKNIFHAPGFVELTFVKVTISSKSIYRSKALCAKIPTKIFTKRRKEKP